MNTLLRLERLRKGWSQQQLADFAAIGHSTVERAEQGKPIRIDSIQRLCECLGKTPEQLGLLGIPDVYHKGRELPPGAVAVADGIIEPSKSSLEQVQTSEEEPMHRREFNRTVLRVAAATFVTPLHVLDTELLDRFHRALTKPATIDERFITYLEARTERYWQERYAAQLASPDLLLLAVEHFQTVTTLLEGTLFPSIRIRLTCIASSTAQLAGHLLFDLGEFIRARQFHRAAIQAAQTANHPALEAVAWGRMSFTWTYTGNAPEALRCIQTARHLAVGNVHPTIRAYLAAVEAEIQAILGNRKACFAALAAAEAVKERQASNAELAWLSFDQSRLAGYQGISFQRLYHREDARTHAFLHTAQQALADALVRLQPAQLERRPILLIDLANTYVQQGEVECACGHAIQAVLGMVQTKSQTVLQRLLTLRDALEPWKATEAVRTLDEQMARLLTVSEELAIA